MLSYFQALTVNKQFPEAEKLALEFLQKEKTYGALYDMLYLEYARQNRLPDGEKLLSSRWRTIPKTATYVTQLATHYFLSKDRPSMDATMKRLMMKTRTPRDICWPGISTWAACANLITRNVSMKPAKSLSEVQGHLSAAPG